MCQEPRRKKFERDSKRGQEKEQEIANILGAEGFSRINFNDDSKWDIRCYTKTNGRTGRYHCIEVKCEDAYSTSGNICVEWKQGKPPRPSGISISLSDITIHTFERYAALYRTRDMRTYIKTSYGTNNFRNNVKIMTLKNSDFQLAQGLIIPVRLLKGKYFFDMCLLQDIANSKVFKLQ